MRKLKKTFQLGSFLLLSLFFFSKSTEAQSISTHFFGVNAWMSDTIGNYYACPEPPCFRGGKLHKHWTKIKDSGASMIRYGGIGPDKNMPTKFQYIRMIDSIRSKGMEPVIQVPFYNYRYTAQQAADIVHYVNVIKGRNVKYWIIANEPNLIYSYTSAAQVAAYFKPFASAMKNVDPSILIIGPETASFKKSMTDDLTNPGGPNDITGKDGAGRYYLDVFSFHTYPMHGGSHTRAEMIPKLTASGSYQDNLIYLNTKLAAANSYHNRTGATALKSAVTETNVTYTNASTDGLNGVGSNSFIGGQFVAEIYGIGLKCGVDFINLWSVIEGGTSVINNGGYLHGSTGNKKPTYYHFKLMADNFRGTNANCTSNQVNVKSFASKDAQQIAVLILNEDLTNNFNYTVRLNTTSITGTSALKLNVNAGLAKEYTAVIQNQSTTLLLFDGNGNIIKKYEYKLSGNANLNLPPTLTILASSSPIATITAAGSTSFCAGGSVTLNANVGTGYSYQWKKDNTIISGATNSSYVVTVSGNYTVTVTTGSGTTTSVSEVVTVMPMPIATITAAGPTSFTAGNSVILNASAGNGYIYQWKKDGVNIIGATNSSYLATQAGSYQVKITLGSCIDWSATITITILSTTTATITPSGPTSFCAGGSVTLNANTGTGYSYQWKKDNTIISGATNSSYVVTVSGNYTVTITAGGGSTTSVAEVVTITPSPTATITAAGPTSFIAGNSVILNASTGTGYTYQWKRDGVNIIGATNSSYVANQAGSYQAQITLGSCMELSASLTITLLPPTATITASGATSFCDGGSVTLNANSGTGYSYQWKKDNVVIVGSVNSYYIATVSGNFSVDITSGGLTATSATQVITVMPMPTATITAAGPTSFTAGNSVILNASAGNGYIYQWKKDGVNISGATNSSYVAAQGGRYQVKITLGSCIDWSAPLTIIILAPVATITVSGPTSFCDGGNVTLNANTGTGYNYQWKKDNVVIGGATSSSYIASVSGSYSVDVTNGSLTNTSEPVVITVIPAPSAVITPSGPTTMCSGSVGLKANSGSGYIYQWQKNNNSITGATNAVYSASTTGSYQVKITQGNCSAMSAPILVKIENVLYASITPAGPTTFCAGGKVILYASTCSGYIYQWKRNGANISGATSSTYTATVSGSYQIKITKNGITDWSAPLMVTVNTCKSVETVSDDGTETDPLASANSISDSEIENSKNFEINVFPNPSNGKFLVELKIENSEEKKFEIEVINNLGQNVYRKNSNFTNGVEEIELNGDIAPGLYILNVKGANSVSTKRIVLNK
ncbi:MAG: T9SS type A sorting domain-containing protein [Bacteroidia bacterium]|nr:T9SS type A sorting domain-containing protein [Bacteroidia bacterium]